MATYFEVLHHLSSGRSFHSFGETYEDIVWEDGVPKFTKEEFLETFETLDQIKNEKNEARISAVNKLAALGLTPEEIAAITNN